MAFGLGAEMASSSNRLNIRWEQGFAALSKFRAREGHCCPSRRYIENNFKLGQWVSVQRYRKDFLTVERKRLLRGIGFVWNAREQFWEQSFAALLKFKRREGHCCVPTYHRENGLKLGWWVATLRRKKGNLKGAADTVKEGPLCLAGASPTPAPRQRH